MRRMCALISAAGPAPDRDYALPALLEPGVGGFTVADPHLRIKAPMRNNIAYKGFYAQQMESRMALDDYDPFSSLDERQQRFVELWVQRGQEWGSGTVIDKQKIGRASAAAIAIEAGYAKSSAYQTGSRLLKDAKILEAIRYLCERALQAQLPLAIGVLHGLLEGRYGKVTSSTVLASVENMLSRAGWIMPKQIEIKQDLRVTQGEEAARERVLEALMRDGMTRKEAEVRLERMIGGEEQEMIEGPIIEVPAIEVNTTLEDELEEMLK